MSIVRPKIISLLDPPGSEIIFYKFTRPKSRNNRINDTEVPPAGLLGATRNARTFILPAESDELKQEKYR